jgi:cation diffusion facilitator family transporter
MNRNNLQKGQKATLIAGLTTFTFAVAKAVIGMISGSIVLLADAVHSGADSFSTATAWFGLKIARREPTEKFRYGFYKAENITALIISGLIFFAGFEIIKESWNKLSLEYDINIPFLAITLAILDAIFMYLVGSYEMKVGKEVNAQSLIADGRESRLHLLSSSLVFVGILAAFLKIPYVEAIFGIIISFVIFQAGFESAKDSIFALMDVSPNKKIEDKIKRILKANLEDFQELKLRKAGPFIFGEVKAKVRKQLSVNEAYKVSSAIELKIKEKVKEVDSFTVSLEPYKANLYKICIPIKEDSEISEHFAKANKFFFIEMDSEKVLKKQLKNNPFKEKKARAGLSAAEWIAKQDIDTVITKEIGPISLHSLRDEVIEVYQTENKEVKDILNDFLKGNLRELKVPTKEKK